VIIGGLVVLDVEVVLVVVVLEVELVLVVLEVVVVDVEDDVVNVVELVVLVDDVVEPRTYMA